MPFNLVASLGLDGTRFAAGLTQARVGVNKFKGELEGGLKGQLAGVFGAAAIAVTAHQVIDLAGKINDFSERTDVSREGLQRWDYALSQNGSSLESGVSFFEKLGVAREKALAGNEEAIASFAAFGVSIDDLKKKRLEDIGLQIGNAVKSGDIQKLGAALREVGGKAATELVPAFKAGLEDAFNEADSLGLIISEQNIKALDDAGDAVDRLATQFKVMLAPAIVFAADALGALMDGIKMVTRIPAAELGALFGGGGFEGMKKAGGETLNQIYAERLASEQSRYKTPEKRVKDLEEDGSKKATKEAEKQLKLKEKLMELISKNNLAELSAAERLKVLQAERSALLASPKSLEDLVKSEELRGQINALDGAKSKEGSGLGIDADSMAKIGGFLGNAAQQNPVVEIAKQQLQQQMMIAANTDPSRKPASNF